MKSVQLIISWSHFKQSKEQSMDLHLTWKVPLSALADVSETNSRIKVTNHQVEKYDYHKK